MIIAIDGPAASGKGVIGKGLAEIYGLAHLDTGLLYRTVGHLLLSSGEDPQQPSKGFFDRIRESVHALDVTELFQNPQLRTSAVGNAASLVATIPEVREMLLRFQQDFAGQYPGAVLDGRDIGTVVCPQAQVKIFVTAERSVRAYRRWKDLCSQGEQISLEAVEEDLRQRDLRDQKRTISPFRAAVDACLLDTTKSDITEVLRAAVSIVDSARAGG